MTFGTGPQEAQLNCTVNKSDWASKCISYAKHQIMNELQSQH